MVGAILLALILVLPVLSAAEKDKQRDKHSAKFGDLHVTTTKMEDTQSAPHKDPRYFPSVLDALRVTDNWGNVYSLRYPNFTDVGGSWFGAELPIPGGSERKEQYKPNESSWAVRLIALDKFVGQMKELRIYLANQIDYPKFYFQIEKTLSLQRDLLRNQPEPRKDEISVRVVTERRVPSR